MSREDGGAAREGGALRGSEGAGLGEGATAGGGMGAISSMLLRADAGAGDGEDPVVPGRPVAVRPVGMGVPQLPQNRVLPESGAPQLVQVPMAVVAL